MGKREQLRKALEDARAKLVAQGCEWNPETGNLLDIKPFEVAYQEAIEDTFPGCIWWELTNYWDIFNAMLEGINDKDMVDEIINHIDPEAFEEGFGCVNEDEDGDPILGEDAEEEPKAIGYYECEFGFDKPEKGTYSICIKGLRKPTPEEAEAFCRRDMANLGLVKCLAVDEIDHDNAVLSYDMDNEDNFPIFGEGAPEPKSIEEEDMEASARLNEGTSNFGVPDHFDLLVFYTYDEFMSIIEHSSEYPNEEDFTQDLGNGDFHVDYDAYEEAKEEYIEKCFEENKVCVLDEDEVERLEGRIEDFNDETRGIASHIEDEDKWDDADYLGDIKLAIEPGYYAAEYINIEHENYLDYLDKALADEQIDRIAKFLEDLRNEFGLTKLGVAWGTYCNSASFVIK